MCSCWGVCIASGVGDLNSSITSASSVCFTFAEYRRPAANHEQLSHIGLSYRITSVCWTADRCKHFLTTKQCVARVLVVNKHDPFGSMTTISVLQRFESNMGTAAKIWQSGFSLKCQGLITRLVLHHPIAILLLYVATAQVYLRYWNTRLPCLDVERAGERGTTRTSASPRYPPIHCSLAVYRALLLARTVK